MAAAARADGVKLALGLECFEQRAQPALDAYAARELDDDGLRAKTEWEARWAWPWEQCVK